MALYLDSPARQPGKPNIAAEDLDALLDEAFDEEMDSEEEMMAFHDIRRGMMEQRSRAKNSFLAEEGDPTSGYGRVRGRLMMPTDLDKWSRDQQRARSHAESTQEADRERSAQIREFVAFGGANAHRTRFTHATRRTQDQAIAGNDDTLTLLLSLQKQLSETSSMQLAFSALQQHVNESDSLLEATLRAHQGHHQHNTVLPSGVPTPSREEFSLLWTPAEEAQLRQDSQNVPRNISGFNLTGESWSQGPHTPNFDASSQTVAIVLPSSGVSAASRGPLQNPTLPSSINPSADVESSREAKPTSGYYSLED